MVERFGLQPGDDPAEFWKASHDAVEEYSEALRVKITTLEAENASLREHVERLATEAALSRPLFSRRQIESRIQELEARNRELEAGLADAAEQLRARAPWAPPALLDNERL